MTEAASATSEGAPEAIDRDSSLAILLRRLVTVPATIAAALLSVLAAPLWIPIVVLIDVIRSGKTAAVRCGAFLCWYLQCQTAGIVAAFLTWLLSGVWAGASRARYLRWNLQVHTAWASALFWGASRIFGFRLQVEGQEVLEGSPFLLLIRHVSNADTLMPAVIVQIPLRYVIKRELLWDPCIDIVGSRLPYYFVRRSSGDPEREIRALGRLVRDMGPGEGVIIYPEGTRFTPEKRAHILRRLRERGETELAARAEKLQNVLPPKLAGTLALLENSSSADAVFCAHVGFEGAGDLKDLWNGRLVDQLIRVRFWRVPRAEIPKDRGDRIDWLFDHWARMDDWIGAARPHG